ncbi:hypothetical protein KAF25_001518 [Fusarium avenaceum]|uniref:Multidrug resistance protein 1 n=1 Tax=Fusarium avenaceum TaxID=40199 RepID=A0A9P7HF05_9HYPO|nr:hypothetical protein KAF25_001518 [Fusarium avenaceum]
MEHSNNAVRPDEVSSIANNQPTAPTSLLTKPPNKRIFAYNDTLGWCLNVVAFICMIATGTLLPLMDLVFGKFVTVFNNFSTGSISADEFRSEVNHYSLWFIYLFIAKFVLSYAWNVLIAFTGIRVTRNIRISFLKQALRQEIAYFDLPDAGSISGQLTTNGNLVGGGVAEKLGLIVQAASTFVAAFIVAFVVQWKLTLIIICIVPASLIVTMGSLVMDTRYEHDGMSVYAKAGLVAEEAFSSIRNIHAFWAFDSMAQRFDSILQQAYGVGLKKSPVLSVLYSFEFFCIYAGYALAFWQGIRLYAKGDISEPGSVVTVIFAVIVAAQALTQVAPQLVHISKAAAAAHELFQVIDRQSKVDPLSNQGAKPSHCHGAIELRDLHFAYPSRPGISVLKGVTLSVPANKTTALVGASGSGKSTIIGLLERFYDPSSGSITIDGQKVDALNVQWLRTNVRLVQQEPTLFSGTVFENVELGLVATRFSDLSFKEKEQMVHEACKAAFAHDFIQLLPEGYNTPVGQRGGMLSGGQKQRIAIARSIVSKPRILLLDEATSALDPNAEKMVQKALNNVGLGRTTLVIAHKLSTIRNADNIVVMSHGEIIEQGTHSELVLLDGSYAKLVQVQHLGQDLGDTQDQPPELDGDGETKGDLDNILSILDSKAMTEALPEEPREVKDYSLIRGITIIFREQKSLWGVFIISFGCCLIAGLTYPALAMIFSRSVDAFNLQGPELTDRGDFFSLMFFVLALANLVAYGVFGWVSNIQAQHIIKSYRYELFTNIVRQHISFFDDPQHTTGALVSRLSTEPQNMMELFSMNIGMVLVNIINVTSSCVLAIAIGWKLGLVLTFGALPSLLVAGYLRIRLETKLDAHNSERFAESAGLATEATMAIRTVASLAVEFHVIEEFKESLRGIAERSMKALGWNMFWYALSQSISFLAMALGFWYGGRLVSTGEYSPVQFYTVFISIIFSGEAAAMFFQFTSSLTKARGSINYILNVRSQVSQDMRDDDTHGEDFSKKDAAAIEFRDLRFSYPRRPGLQVLKGINTTIQPGSFVAFVGPSGCGKSTMIALLERFYDPVSGAIMLDGKNITAKSLRQYRTSVALVQQEPVLYQGSIGDNIALGYPSSTPPTTEVIMAAATSANIHDFILSLPDGLNTPCGALGAQLSGGQRQRIAIARALIRTSRLLLLDEATSALDTESEKTVQAAIDQASSGRTTIVVAHRLSTIRNADCIYVFSRGHIAECGTHSELLSQHGMYYEMCLSQGLDEQAS